jgi:cobalamin biosynthesis protein CobW
VGAAAEDDLAGRPSLHDAEAEHDHDDFESFHVELPELGSAQKLLEAIAMAVSAYDILRIKGFLAVAGKEMRLVFQGVGGRLQHYYDRAWAPGEERASRLVVIGLKGLDRRAITDALAAGAG